MNALITVPATEGSLLGTAGFYHKASALQHPLDVLFWSTLDTLFTLSGTAFELTCGFSFLFPLSEGATC